MSLCTDAPLHHMTPALSLSRAPLKKFSAGSPPGHANVFMRLCVYAYAHSGKKRRGERRGMHHPDTTARRAGTSLLRLAACFSCFLPSLQAGAVLLSGHALGALGYGIPVHKRILYAKWRPGPAASIFFSLLASCSCEAGGLLVRAPVAVLCVPLCNNWRRDPGGDDSAYVSVSVRAFACVWKGTGTGTGCASPASSAGRDAPGVQRSVGRGCCSSR